MRRRVLAVALYGGVPVARAMAALRSASGKITSAAWSDPPAGILGGAWLDAEADASAEVAQQATEPMA
jgi:hypothetical protein